MLRHPEDVVEPEALVRLMKDKAFPGIHQRFTNGYHFAPDDQPEYNWIKLHFDLIEAFYRFLRAEIVHREGYFFLLSHDEAASVRTASREEMIVGLSLVWVYLDTEQMLGDDGGIRFDDLLDRLVHDYGGEEAYVRCFSPRRKITLGRQRGGEVDRRVEKTVRLLAQYGFVELAKDDARHLIIRPRRSIYRFVEVLRGIDGDDIESLRGNLNRLQVEGKVLVLQQDSSVRFQRDRNGSVSAGFNGLDGDDPGALGDSDV